jgi:acetylglutamate kinase
MNYSILLKNLGINFSDFSHFNNKKILVKYGGNAMKSDELKNSVTEDIAALKSIGFKPVLVHGGGPAIAETLDMAGIVSEFIGGHRKTDIDAIKFVEMALKGKVNTELIKLLNSKGQKAVGLSGKDANMVIAKKRTHSVKVDNKTTEIDLGQVGDADEIDTSLIDVLLDNDYIPVVAPLGIGRDYETYNINADMFAGNLAGALKVDDFVVLTDVDGLREDKDNPSTLIEEINSDRVKAEMGNIIQGGMLPKMESCLIALETGVKNAHIINGMEKHSLLTLLLSDKKIGTLIKK